MLMTVPPELPNSALNMLVWTLKYSPTSTVRAYLAAGKVVKKYRPAESETVENWTLRSESVTAILAFGTADFEVSVIVPRIDPVYDWAHERAENKQTGIRKLRTILPPF